MVTISKGAKWIYASNVESANVVGINTETGELLVFASSKYGIGFAGAKTYQMIIHLDIPYKPFSLHT